MHEPYFDGKLKCNAIQSIALALNAFFLMVYLTQKCDFRFKVVQFLRSYYTCENLNNKRLQ